MRIKCPNCGSTAQVALTWRDTDNYSTIENKEYICGCGCMFSVEFKAISTKILEVEEKFGNDNDL